MKKLWDLAAQDNDDGDNDDNDDDVAAKKKKKKDWPVYYYENIEGGHGGAADAKQSAFMNALAYDFMWNTLTSNTSEQD